jgi:hypothetical protein
VRVLILVLCAAVVGLTVLVLVHAGGGAREGQAGARFLPAKLLYDAQEGEEASYRDGEGNTLVWTVLKRISSEQRGQERLLIRRRLLDRTGNLMSPTWGEVSYEHDFALHKYYPLMAPQEPDGLDRRWVWAQILQEVRTLRGKDALCWRVDFVDPALPLGEHEVRTWFHEDVAVFGLLEWHHYGRTWTLVSSRRPK